MVNDPVYNMELEPLKTIAFDTEHTFTKKTGAKVIYESDPTNR